MIDNRAEAAAPVEEESFILWDLHLAEKKLLREIFSMLYFSSLTATVERDKTSFSLRRTSFETVACSGGCNTGCSKSKIVLQT